MGNNFLRILGIADDGMLHNIPLVHAGMKTTSPTPSNNLDMELPRLESHKPYCIV